MKPPRLWLGSLVSLAAGGCQSLREQLPAANCPPTFDDGFEAGCSSGRSAAGPLGHFGKDTSRYQHEPLYAQGWDGGFQQCERVPRIYGWKEYGDEQWRDQEWCQHIHQATARTLRRWNFLLFVIKSL